MTAVLETASARPTWRYLDDAPPVSSPSRKRTLGAVLAYLAATTGVGAAIFWPSNDQALAFSEFKIPPSPFTTSTAARPAPQPNPSSAPGTNRLATVANQPLRSQPKQSSKYLRPASSASGPATVAVMTPDTPHEQVQATWIPESHTRRSTPPASTNSRPSESQTTPKSTTPNQTETQQRPQSRDTNSDGDLNHPVDSDPSNSGTTKPSTNSAPQPDSAPAPASAPKKASDSAPAAPPTVTDNPGVG
jgi:hypothetical protein